MADTVDNQRRLSEAFALLGEGKESEDVVLELLRKDIGKPVWVQWRSRPAPNGEYTRTMMVDITERVLIEQTKAALEFTLESGQISDWDLDLIKNTSRRSLHHDQCFGYTHPIPEADWGFDATRILGIVMDITKRKEAKRLCVPPKPRLSLLLSRRKLVIGIST